MDVKSEAQPEEDQVDSKETTEGASSAPVKDAHEEKPQGYATLTEAEPDTNGAKPVKQKPKSWKGPCCTALFCSNKQLKRSSLDSSDRARDITFHRFPQKPDLIEKWLRAMHRMDANKPKSKRFRPTRTTVICSQHFKPEDFGITSSKRRRLKAGAIPSIFNLPPHLKHLEPKPPKPRREIIKHEIVVRKRIPKHIMQELMLEALFKDHTYFWKPDPNKNRKKTQHGLNGKESLPGGASVVGIGTKDLESSTCDLSQEKSEAKDFESRNKPSRVEIVCNDLGSFVNESSDVENDIKCLNWEQSNLNIDTKQLESSIDDPNQVEVSINRLNWLDRIASTSHHKQLFKVLNW